MRHLAEDDLLDLAEGVRPEASTRHLASCEACRRQLADLRSVMSTAAAVDVPEPSPLFWERFSARVREAIEAEGRPPAAGWLPQVTFWRAAVPLGALTALILAAVLIFRPGSDPSTVVDTIVGSRTADGALEPIDALALAEDPSLSLLADLTSEVDWDAAREAGLAPRAGAVDYLVTALSTDERVELQRLLQEALSRPGA